jgi:hypothetical protein
MPDGNFTFAKIVATPTEDSWSQAYNAGKLFTVLSIKKSPVEEKSTNTEEEVSQNEEESLKAIGKKILDSLEAEFFTLEEKNLQSIKQAISTAVSQISKDIEFSFATAVLSGNILYAYTCGLGKVFIKRNDKFGPILEASDEQEVSSVSGFLQNGDLVVIETAGFSEVITKEALANSLDSLPPTEIAENLAPKIHEAKEATAAAIILSYKEEAEASETMLVEESLEIDTISVDENIERANEKNENKNPLIFLAPLFSGVKKLIPEKLNHSRKIYLTIAVLILIVLITSVLLGMKKQNDTKIQAAFDAIYPTAQKKYDTGVSLKDLNQNLATDNFTAAKKILDDNKNKFSTDSSQEKQIMTLLAKVDKELTVSPTPTSLDKSKITITIENGSGAEGVAGKASDFLKGLGYNVSGTANADNYNYSGATIKVKDSAKAYLDGLKSDLLKGYTVSSASADLSASSPTDAVVIIGK